MDRTMNDLDFIKQEDAQTIKRHMNNATEKNIVLNNDKDVLKKALKEAISESKIEVNLPEIVVKNELPKEFKVSNLSDIKIPEVKIPESKDFPSKIEVSNLEKIKFPTVQEVKFKLPDFAKSFSQVLANLLPLGKDAEPNKDTANPSKYMVVRLSNGKAFYDAVTSTVQSSGKLASKLEELIALMNPNSIGSVPLTGRKLVASTGVAIQISSAQPIRNGVIIQALSANTTSVYVGGQNVTTSTGFELQAGQATSIAVNNLGLLYVNGTAGDGICFIAAN